MYLTLIVNKQLTRLLMCGEISVYFTHYLFLYIILLSIDYEIIIINV